MALLLVSTSRSAESAVITYTVAELQGLTVNSLTPNLIVADLIAGTSIDVMTGVGRQTDPLSDTYVIDNAKMRRDAASNIDGHWIQTDNSEIWDLGQASNRIVVGNAFDHDRYSESLEIRYLESLEYTAWGSNDPLALFNGQLDPGIWELARIGTIYAQGYDPGAVWDDFTAELFFPTGGSYRYVHVIAQDSIGVQLFANSVVRSSADNEIDFVARIGDVPEPATLALLGLGLVGVLHRRRVH